MKKDNKKTLPKGLGIFGKGKTEPCPKDVWNMYSNAQSFNQQMSLDRRLKVCRNFYDGKQWDGIPDNGMPQPVINFVARTLNFTVSNMASDKVTGTVSPLGHAQNKDNIDQVVSVINNAFEQISEFNDIPHLIREFYLNSAVDGNGCLYTYWDSDINTGQSSKGMPRIEVVDCNRIMFGNPSSKIVETQPWIMMIKRLPLREVKIKAWENEMPDWDTIKADGADDDAVDDSKYVDDLCTVITIFYREYGSKKIWTYECTETNTIKEATCMDITRYPFVWLGWRAMRDTYRGTSAVEGLAQSQMIVNQIASIGTTIVKKVGFPVRVIDKTRIKKLTDKPNGVIEATGDVTGAITTVQGAALPPESYNFMQLIMKMSMETLGATEVAVGDTRPDNTSAILAVTRASVTPQEGVKHDGEDCVKNLYRILFSFIVNYFGKRDVWLPLRESEMKQIQDLQARGWAFDVPDRMRYKDFDFSEIKDSEFDIKTNIGQSSYYQQMQSETIAEELLRLKAIRPSEFLDCLKTDSLPNMEKLRQKLEQREQQEDKMNGMMGGSQQMPGAGMVHGTTNGVGGALSLAELSRSKDIHGGGGYGDLQRKTAALGGVDPGRE